jgi:succinoglycan biosynthesis protein ExoA
MPVRNEADFIARSLGSVLQQDYPENRMEILVVDGNSKDGTPEKIQSSRVKVLDNAVGIVPAALNIGLRHATGDVIIKLTETAFCRLISKKLISSAPRIVSRLHR